MELITPDLICPSTYQLLWYSGGDSRLELSFDKSASPERLFSLARVSFAEASKLVLSVGCFGGDYTSSCPPSLVSAKLAYRADDDLRHPDAAIDDPRPATGSFNMADMRCLSAHVVKLRDMPEGVLVLSGLGRVWKSRICDPVLRGADRNEEPHLDVRPTLQRLPFYCTPPATADAVIPEPAPEDLAIGNSDDESDGDDDACVEIPLVTPLRYTVVIPPLGNHGRSSAASAAEVSNTQDSLGKGIMVDDATAPSGGVSRPRPSSRPAPSFKDVSGDAIHTDFFPFSAIPYYATYPKGGIAGNSEFTRKEWDAPYRPNFRVLTKEVFKDPAVCKLVVDPFPTLGEVVWVESLSDDQLTAKMSMLHCMMMSHGGELLACYRGLNQSHHEYVLSTDSRMKGYEEKVASLTGLKLQVPTLKKQVSGLNDKLATSDASFAKSKAKGKEMKKILTKRDEEILQLKTTTLEFSSFFRGQFQGLVHKFLASDEFSRVQGELLSLAASAVFERGLSMHQTKDEFATVLKKMANFMPGAQDRLLELEKLARPANVPTPRDTRVSPPISKESTVTPVSKSLEQFINVVSASSVVASKGNEEQVYATVDGSDLEMADSAARSKSGGVFVQGASHALDDVAEVIMVGSESVSSGPNDVVVSLSVGEKGDGLTPSSVAGEEAAINPSEV
ncbi:hypothetical protein Tco_0599729 [Tanacetum coccineum]